MISLRVNAVLSEPVEFARELLCAFPPVQTDSLKRISEVSVQSLFWVASSPDMMGMRLIWVGGGYTGDSFDHRVIQFRSSHKVEGANRSETVWGARRWLG
jgi:hypothetical protein